MSKNISSHNLSQFDYLIKEMQKDVFILKIFLKKSDDIKDKNALNVIFSIIYDSALKLENNVNNLEKFDNCIRSEIDYGSDGGIND